MRLRNYGDNNYYSFKQLWLSTGNPCVCVDNQFNIIHSFYVSGSSGCTADHPTEYIRLYNSYPWNFLCAQALVPCNIFIISASYPGYMDTPHELYQLTEADTYPYQLMHNGAINQINGIILIF